LLDAVRARDKASPSALPPAERLRLGRLAVQHAETTGQPLAALWGHKWRIDAAYELADMTSLLTDLAQVSELAARTRLPLIRWHDLRMRCSIAALLGRFAEAVELNEQARVLAVASLRQDASAAGMSEAFALQHALITGDVSGMAVARTALRHNAGDIPMVAVSRGLVALLLGRQEEAAAEYEDLRRRLAEPGMAALPQYLVNLVPLIVAFGDTSTAALVRDALLGHTLTQGGIGTYCSGSLRRPLGRLEVLLGRLDDAVAHLVEALALDARCGARPLVVLDRISLACALLERRAAGDVERAQGLARQAADEARRLGMPGPLRTTTALVDRTASAARDADPLTGREREIAQLVSAAMTNRQIAERLFLSERTVESHVRNILAKLGVANRTEIATVTVSATRAGGPHGSGA
jgi:DNA-binding CsgD family transcriptional regulator